jgi:hypothetical protein
VPNNIVFQLAILLFLGWSAKGDDNLLVWRGFTGVNDMLRRSSKAQQLLSPYMADLNRATLQRQMARLIPKLSSKKKPVDFRPKLSTTSKKKRLACAKRLLRLPMKQLRGVIFLDAKKLWIEPGNFKVYMLDKDLAVEDCRLPEGKQNSGVSLHYYAAVNAELGVVHSVWVTGTTDLEKGYKTLVSQTTDSAALIDFA